METNGTIGLNVADIVSTWILQMGYPVVTIHYDNSSGDVNLAQEHYLLDPSKAHEKPESDFGLVLQIRQWHESIKFNLDQG